jgi:serine/threonine-protein phosphatase 2A regulatory subunit A
LSKVVDVMSPEQVEQHVVPIIRRLSSADWFTSRTSACGIYPSVYHKCTNPATQEELRRLYAQLCQADTPMVRRAAATHLSKFVGVMTKQQVTQEIVPLFLKLARDEQDSVRLLTVADLIAVAQLLSPQEVAQVMLEPMRVLSQDQSWRVRYMVAEKFNQVYFYTQITNIFLACKGDGTQCHQVGLGGDVCSFAQGS